jgi:hypothetical protein
LSDELRKLLGPLGKVKGETGFEAFYNAQVFAWLNVSGDLQVIGPALPGLGTAIFLGVRTRIGLPDYALPSVTKHLVASQQFCVVSGGCVDGSQRRAVPERYQRACVRTAERQRGAMPGNSSLRHAGRVHAVAGSTAW